MSGIFLLLVASLLSVESLSCTAQYQCTSVSTDYNYVQCLAGQCSCLINLGFTGNATPAFKCQCASPSSVFWQNSVPYCIRLQDAVSWKLDKAQEAHQNAIVSQIYGDLIWPTPAIIMGNLIAGLPTGIGDNVALDAIGRVDPLGTFETQDGIVEYFYGATWTGAAKIFNTTFIYLFSRGSVTYMSVNIEITVYDATQEHILEVYVLRQTGTFRFNSQGLVESMDLVIHNLGPNSNRMSPPFDESQISTYCGLIVDIAHCNSTFDPTGFYTNLEDCKDHFRHVFRWGTWDDIWFNGNTSICRIYHSLLAVGRPEVHCPHAGRNGGGVCVDHLYATYFDSFY